MSFARGITPVVCCAAERLPLRSRLARTPTWLRLPARSAAKSARELVKAGAFAGSKLRRWCFPYYIRMHSGDNEVFAPLVTAFQTRAELRNAMSSTLTADYLAQAAVTVWVASAAIEVAASEVIVKEVHCNLKCQHCAPRGACHAPWAVVH